MKNFKLDWPIDFFLIEDKSAALYAAASGKKLDSIKIFWSHKSNLKKCIVFYF